MEKNRSELINELRKITFAVFLTALTSEYCYEVITLTSKGIKYQWIGYDEWTVYRLEPCDPEKWSEIRNKIQEGTLGFSDLNGTELTNLINCTIGKDSACNYSLLFQDLGKMPIKPPNKLYCYCDSETQTYYFTDNQEELRKILAEEYSSIDTLWEDMDNEYLEMWLDRYKEEGQDIPCTFFSE